MSAKTQLGSLAVNAQAKATAELLNDGFFDLMDGDQPESADQEVSEEQRLARWSFGTVAFANPKDGVLNANPILKTVATKTGDPTWCRAVTKDGVTVFVGTAGTSDANAISPVETIVKGQIVKVDALTHIIRKQSR